VQADEKRGAERECGARSEFSEGIGRCFYSFSLSQSVCGTTNSSLEHYQRLCAIKPVCDLLLKLSRPRLSVCEKSVKTNNKAPTAPQIESERENAEWHKVTLFVDCWRKLRGRVFLYGYAEFFKRDENEWPITIIK
jgi:hypothetical protein